MKAKLLIAIALSLVLSGCSYRLTKAPFVPQTPRVIYANSLLAAADAVDLVAQGNDAANHVLLTLSNGGSISLPEYVDAHGYLVKIAQANDKAIAAIHAAQLGSTTVDWRSAILAIADTASQADPAKFGFKDANARASFLLSLDTLKAALTVIPKSFSKPNGGN